MNNVIVPKCVHKTTTWLNLLLLLLLVEPPWLHLVISLARDAEPNCHHISTSHEPKATLLAGAGGVGSICRCGSGAHSVKKCLFSEIHLLFVVNDDDEDDEEDEGNFEVFRGLYFSKEREKKSGTKIRSRSG